MFKQYDPLKGKIVRIIDDNGKLLKGEELPENDDEFWVKAMEKMLFARQADLMAVSFQRQGRMFTYPPNLGQEAIATAVGLVNKEEDWFVPAFRELAGWLAKGAQLHEIFLYFKGDEKGSKFVNAPHLLPSSVPIASQLLHAAGIGYSLRHNKKPGVVYGFVGDGGTSEGDFHEALNFAGVWKAPVIFIVQNNQFAISVPRKKQSAAESLAAKGIGYGIPALHVDGNDIMAMYKAVKFAREYAEAGNGPVLIEAETFRMGAHTTSDDPTRYRTVEMEEEWAQKDPVKRLRQYLVSRKLWDEAHEEKLVEEYKEKVEFEFKKAEELYKIELNEIFDYTFEELPPHLLKQKVEYENYLHWKEGRK
jgi:pyruvate dehydrogenase E1 component alpha subunit